MGARKTASTRPARRCAWWPPCGSVERVVLCRHITRRAAPGQGRAARLTVQHRACQVPPPPETCARKNLRNRSVSAQAVQSFSPPLPMHLNASGCPRRRKPGTGPGLPRGAGLSIQVFVVVVAVVAAATFRPAVDGTSLTVARLNNHGMRWPWSLRDRAYSAFVNRSGHFWPCVNLRVNFP